MILCEMTRGVVTVSRGRPPFGQANEGCLHLHGVGEWERSQVWALKRVRPCSSPDGRQRDSLLRQPVWEGVRGQRGKRQGLWNKRSLNRTIWTYIYPYIYIWVFPFASFRAKHGIQW